MSFDTTPSPATVLDTTRRVLSRPIPPSARSEIEHLLAQNQIIAATLPLLDTAANRLTTVGAEDASQQARLAVLAAKVAYLDSVGDLVEVGTTALCRLYSIPRAAPS